MRLVTYHRGDRLVLGLVHGDNVLAVSDGGGPDSLQDLVDMGLAAARQLLETLPGRVGGVPLESVEFGPSVPKPRNVICVGKNYPLHAAEEGEDVPPLPLLFAKHTSTVAGHGQSIRWDPTMTQQVDWEVELGAVIGREARNVPEREALDYVFGYTAANDVSARDIQFGDGQWLRGKSLDTFLPIGPVVVTAEEIPDPQVLDLELRVNGEVKQRGNTAEMYYPVRHVISFASRSFTLLPGDIILTGTPAGVGVFRDPPEFLSDGDVVEVEVERIGVLRSHCVAQPVEPSVG